MQFQIEKIKPAIGAVIHGVNLNELNDENLVRIHQALLDHQVIFFRNQNLSPRNQANLANSFGSLHIHPIFPNVEDVPEILILDSLKQDLRDNELWHTDVTFSKTPPLGCVLQAKKIPAFGGDTFWSTGIGAFRTLPKEIQHKLLGLTAVHDIRQSFPIERYAKTDEERQKLLQIFEKNPPVVHPVVRTHPITKEPILFVSEGFTTKINELETSESDELLKFLFEHSTQPDLHVRWQWAEGDVAIWDNRCTQHKALFDYGDAHRIMHRATINGDVPFYKAA
ncbi:taurine dioxygenase [Acinetobacter nectaris]|uniref:taurine dioxygenase n=1 Tax=Acinetobacter nectaris TaxID=1219382 RepID=UPI001F02AC83|nr:taurine dioxygenase [Acinetobacter nectaris]MCF8999989.1 taurine dioxygenase [Acinetobacter nectaris]MCF9028370.1 taurine dioxygenase [Acinetobacter nectaris]